MLASEASEAANASDAIGLDDERPPRPHEPPSQSPLLQIQRHLTRRVADGLARQGRSFARSEVAVLAVAFAFGTAALRWSFSRSLQLRSLDSQSHLVIARRLTDTREPGLAQFGTVWLPLPHLLLAPFTLVRSWWASGLSGGLLGLACLLLTSVALFRTAARATASAIGGWLAVACFVATPSVLYVHTTAMTEPVLLLTVALTMAGVAGWESRGWTDTGGEIIVFAGVPAAGVVLSRYEGYAFVVAAAAYVFAKLWLWRGLREALRRTAQFVVVPVVASAGWLVYNAACFGDPLAFQRGEGSSVVQMQRRRATGSLVDLHDLRRSASTYLWVAQSMCGRLLLGVSLVSLLVYLAGFGPRMRTSIALAPLAMGAFHVMSLWAGQTYMAHDYAVRYGIVVIPAVVVFAAWALLQGVRAATALVTTVASWTLGRIVDARSRARALVIVTVAALSATVAVQAGHASAGALLHEGELDVREVVDVREAADWLRANRHDDRDVLLDDVSSPVLVPLGLSLRDVVASFSGPLWGTAVRGHPEAVAGWAVVRTGAADRVGQALKKRPEGWVRAYANNGASVYRYDRERDADRRPLLSSASQTPS